MTKKESSAARLQPEKGYHLSQVYNHAILKKELVVVQDPGFNDLCIGCTSHGRCNELIELAVSIKTYILRRMGSDGKYCMEQSSDSLANTLSKVLDTGETTLIECGGKDQVASAREQWNDGANTLCISPGVVIVYDRNRVTNKIMEDLGVKVITSPSSELARKQANPKLSQKMQVCVRLFDR